MRRNCWAESVRTGLAEEAKVKQVSWGFTTHASREDLQSRAFPSFLTMEFYSAGLSGCISAGALWKMLTFFSTLRSITQICLI